MDVLFIIGDRNAKVESQETPGVTGKFGLEENALVIANTLFQLCVEKTLNMDITRRLTLKSD